jgi:hypothetical protein
MFQMNKEKFAPRFPSLGINVDGVLAKFPTVKYVGQFPLRNKSGEFTDFAADVFYEPNPNLELGHSNYFSVYRTSDGVYITKADHVETLLLNVYTDTDGNFIYPRFQHDFRGFDGNHIDGGAWIESNEKPGMKEMYGRFIGDMAKCRIRQTAIVKDGEFYSI